MIRNQDIVKEVLRNIWFLDDKKIKKGLEEQLESKRPLHDVFVKLGYISKRKVGKTLIPQIGIPPLPLSPKEIDKRNLNLLPSKIALLHRIVPLRREGDMLILGTDDPLNLLAERNLGTIVGLPVGLELIRTQDLEETLEHLYVSKAASAHGLGNTPEGIKEAEAKGDAPIIKLVNMIIGEAVRRRASDIHLEPLENKFRVRYRIDGVLHEVSGPPKNLEGSVISRLKIMAGMDIAEKRLPQDGRINIRLDRRELDLRVSSLPGIHGESLVMRILDKSSFLVGLEDLGFLPGQRKAIEKLITMPNGMLLLTGPAGSGKTTTLYAILKRINQKERKVITIEDPVEYQLEGINQVQVEPRIGLTFAGGLRSMLRQAPDIIRVGEIRDLETAQIAIQSALTGHMIFSALHTNEAASAVTRLTDMGIKPYLVASTLQAVLAQRLVRIVCPSCRESYKPSEEEGTVLSLTPQEMEEVDLYRGKGCPSCSNTGFKGRIGIFELLIITDEIRDMILNKASSSAIWEKARTMGARSLKEDGIEKIKKGFTTLQEVMRVTQDG